MHVEDKIHLSHTTSKEKYDGALQEWFSFRAIAHSSTLFSRHLRLPSPPGRTTTTTIYATILTSNTTNYNNL
ncbi:unnamed protein product [Rotaria sp. Silwood1]|nr:unnamed protein product [Rotaria sp. Silwood1]